MAASNSFSFDSTCAALGGGKIKCWGNNFDGQLGDGKLISSPTPVAAKKVAKATQITIGDSFVCARVSRGRIKSWGRGLDGQLGNGVSNDRSVPVTVSKVANATQVASGDAFACAALATGAVKCWGFNRNGELGSGSPSKSEDKPRPAAVSGIKNATQVSTGSDSACARLASGQVECWGDGEDGELGNGKKKKSWKPATTIMAATAQVPQNLFREAVSVA